MYVFCWIKRSIDKCFSFDQKWPIERNFSCFALHSVFPSYLLHYFSTLVSSVREKNEKKNNEKKRFCFWASGKMINYAYAVLCPYGNYTNFFFISYDQQLIRLLCLCVSVCETEKFIGNPIINITKDENDHIFTKDGQIAFINKTRQKRDDDKIDENSS